MVSVASFNLEGKILGRTRYCAEVRKTLWREYRGYEGGERPVHCGRLLMGGWGNLRGTRQIHEEGQRGRNRPEGGAAGGREEGGLWMVKGKTQFATKVLYADPCFLILINSSLLPFLLLFFFFSFPSPPLNSYLHFSTVFSVYHILLSYLFISFTSVPSFPLLSFLLSACCVTQWTHSPSLFSLFVINIFRLLFHHNGSY